MRRLLIIAGLLAMLALGAIGAIVVQGHTGDATEVRITAQRLEDGRTEFALQQRTGDTWSDRILPSGRYFPADAEAGRWLNSTPIHVGSAEFQPIVINATGYPGSDTLLGELWFRSWQLDDGVYTACKHPEDIFYIGSDYRTIGIRISCWAGAQFLALTIGGTFYESERFTTQDGITTDVTYRFSGPYDEVTEAWRVAVTSDYRWLLVPVDQFETFMSRIRENRTLDVSFDIPRSSWSADRLSETFRELGRLLTTYVQPNIERCGEY